jgi:hypothetical protein
VPETVSKTRAVLSEAEYSLLLSDDHTTDVTTLPRSLIGPTRSLPVLLSQMQIESLYPPDAILSPEGEYARLRTERWFVFIGPTLTSPIFVFRIRIVPSLHPLAR